MKQNDQVKQPFFAQFLESDKPQEEKSDTQTQQLFPPFTRLWTDDHGDQTHKYPSDSDEGGV